MSNFDLDGFILGSFVGSLGFWYVQQAIGSYKLSKKKVNAKKELAKYKSMFNQELVSNEEIVVAFDELYSLTTFFNKEESVNLHKDILSILGTSLESILFENFDVSKYDFLRKNSSFSLREQYDLVRINSKEYFWIDIKKERI